MEIFFTIESSSDVISKVNVVHTIESDLNDYFHNKTFSEDLQYLYIGIFCVSPKFQKFFARRKPKYTGETKTYIFKGVELEKKAKTFEYELELDYEKYYSLDDARESLANDIIDSLDSIIGCKKLKNLDILSLKSDFKHFLEKIKWL